ncbi:hypothetical protein NB717_002257 [Xanthomonas sacchari]|nr:hypothetical protein [Xanthomonas sacchari]MCW0450880.1 hypothetical protein [Xanthomonas sacchari]MCW0461189.1 hypothetical protein [Xanthomonas sacchari]
MSSWLTLTTCASAIQRASRARHTAMSGSTVGRTFGSSEISRCPRSRSASAWKVLAVVSATRV